MAESITLEDIPLDDRKTYDMLSRGLNVGVFQLEKRWVRGILRDVAPEKFQDIIALVALLRPGSLDSNGPARYARNKRDGKSNPDIHPRLDQVIEPLVRETYGVVLYQEQVMQIIAAVTGWGYAEADDIFNAMRKKQVEKMEHVKPSFIAAASRRGFPPDAIDALWDVLIPFSDYSFGKAHSVGYAYISYWTAYLKANYPIEFIAALMTGDAGDKDKILEYIEEASRLGIAILPPSVNVSDTGFTPTKQGIRYGLEGIKDVGKSAIPAILDQRPFNSLDDFFQRVDTGVLTARVLPALIWSGALDCLWPDRQTLVAEAARIARRAIDQRRRAAFGEQPLIRARYEPGYSGARDFTALAEGEKETIGVSLTHPDILLRVSRPLSAPETAWLTQVLMNRPPLSHVYLMDPYGVRSRLSMKSSVEGLAKIVASLGISVQEV